MASFRKRLESKIFRRFYSELSVGGATEAGPVASSRPSAIRLLATSAVPYPIARMMGMRIELLA